MQLLRDRARLQSQLEGLLEEGRIKLSSVVSDLLGASGRRILRALASGETNPARLALLGDDRLKCTQAQLQEALRGSLSPIQRELLTMYLEQIELMDRQVLKLEMRTAQTMRACREAVMRLAGVPGIQVIAAQQIVAEAGSQAATFPSSSQSTLGGSSPSQQSGLEDP